MANAVTVHEGTVEDRLSASLYKDGLLQVSISDDVVVELDRLEPNTEEAARNALLWMVGKVGQVIPIEVEGRDFNTDGRGF